MNILADTFPIVNIYNFHNLTYPGGLWSFTYASKKYHPLKDFNDDLVKKSNLEFGYYNAEVHRGAFALPEFMKKNIGKFIKD